MPGLLVLNPPRKVARGRERDRLVLHLSLAGNSAFTTAEFLQMTSQAAEQFYASSGSLTAAMRAAADTLNRDLLERNMRTTGQGRYSIGTLVMIVPRGSQLTVLASGPAHVFCMGREPRHIHEPSLAGRGLGLSQTLTQYFTQIELAPGERMLFCASLPAAWEAPLAQDRTPATIDSTRRRLVTIDAGDLNAVLLQTQDGRGLVNLMRAGQAEREPAPTPLPVAQAPAVPSTPGPGPVSGPASAPAPAPRQPPAWSTSAPSTPERTATPQPQPAPASVRQPPASFPASIPRAQPRPVIRDEAPEIGELDRAPLADARPLRTRDRGTPAGARKAARAAVGLMQGWRNLTGKIRDGFNKMLPKLLPDSEPDMEFDLNWQVKLAISIIVPLIVATVAYVVFNQYGKGGKYNESYAQAESTAQLAAMQTDPVAQRTGWEQTLGYIDQAERYRKTDQSAALRRQAQENLDKLLGVTRLNFQLAFNGGLPKGTLITRMAANDTDLYMLDAVSGQVFRAYTTGSGYLVDLTFDCAPGQFGGFAVTQLVDIITLPRANSTGATVVGVDGGGNLLYCAPGSAPQAVTLAPPDTNWGHITAVSLDSDNMYVLDSSRNAVWIYDGDDGKFPSLPLFFFAEQIPALADAVDLAVSGDDLYLLHADGHLSVCVRSRLDTVPTRCVDPAPLTDPHPAAQGRDTFAPSHFIQVSMNVPPDPFVLLLDTNQRAIFSLSPRALELLDQVRGEEAASGSLPTDALTAMAVSPNHVIFLATGGAVYYAADIP
jgi:hypothetical protein